jgi:hypothetical protein
MPYAQFGEKVNFNSSQFLKLKSKGDSVKFRILGIPYIDGKHFTKTADGKWDIQACPRVNEHGKCEMCSKFFSIIMKAKKTEDKTLIEQAKKEAEPFKCSVSVYYPVINRETEAFAVFQTTMGVREEIEAEAALGTKVMESDFTVMRTEVPGKYYRFSKVDSADTKPLSDKEVEGVEHFKTLKLDEIVNGTADDESNVAIEANSEVIEELVEEV